jgi:hypothetical protein
MRAEKRSQPCAENSLDVIEPKLDRIAFLAGLGGKGIQIRLGDSILAQARDGEPFCPFIELLDEQVTGSGNVGIRRTGERLTCPGILDKHRVFRASDFLNALYVHAAGFGHQGCANDAMGNIDQSPKGSSKTVDDSQPCICQCDSGQESRKREG